MSGLRGQCSPRTHHIKLDNSLYCFWHYTYYTPVHFLLSLSLSQVYVPFYPSVSLQLIGRSLELRLLLLISCLSAFSYRATADSPTWQPWVKDARCYSNLTAKLFTVYTLQKQTDKRITYCDKSEKNTLRIQWIGHFRPEYIHLSQTIACGLTKVYH